MKNPFSRMKGDSVNVDSPPPTTSSERPADDRNQALQYENTYDSSIPAAVDSDTQSFRVEYDAYWNAHTTVHIKDPSGKEVYTLDARMRKPQLTVRAASSDAAIATVVQHATKWRIEVTFHGKFVQIEPHGKLNPDFSYASSVMPGQTFTWKPQSLDDIKMALLDEQAMPIARFVPRYRGSVRGGTLELTRQALQSPEATEEVIVFGMAVIHLKETMRMSVLSG